MAVVLADVDGTLITGSSLSQFFAYLARFSSDAKLVGRIQELSDRASEYTDHDELIVDALALLKGQQWEEMRTIGRAWYEESGRHQYVTAVRERLEAHNHDGDVVVFVSASWLPCLEPIARDLGVDHILCCRAEVKNGLFTGTIDYPVYGAAKVARTAEFLSDHELTLAGSVAYGDDPADLEMLLMAERSVVVGSNPILRKAAVENGWEVISAEFTGA